MEDYKKYKKELKKKWLDKNGYKSQILGNQLGSMNPEVGFYVNVNGIEVSEDFFKKEFSAISKAYNSVIKKMEKHYRKNNESKSFNPNKGFEDDSNKAEQL